MAEGCVISITDEDFAEEVLQNPGTVLVDFYTPHCAPCRKVAPILEELCQSNTSGLKVVKVDASVNVDAAIEHNVSAVPTFVLFHKGHKVSQITGYQSRPQFEKWIASATGH